MGCPFYLRGVPLGFHHLLIFFLGQGFVNSLSPYPFFLLLFLLGLGFENFFFLLFYLSPQHIREPEVQGFMFLIQRVGFIFLMSFRVVNFASTCELGFGFGFLIQRLLQHLHGRQLGGRLRKGGCRGTRATLNRGNIAVGSSRARSPLDSPSLDYFSL